MKETWKRRLRPFVPRTFRTWWRLRFGWRWFEGDYGTWAEARAKCRGYDDARIVEKVLQTTLLVAAGRGAYERDGVLFAEPKPEPGLIAALREVASARRGRLRLLDFGGGLGTTYWRHRAALSDLEALRWDVVEQAPFAAAGRRHFSGGALHFFESIAEAQRTGPHDALLVSTTLQYLEAPHAVLGTWMSPGWPFIVFNNLPLHRRLPDRLAVQRVPPEIYPGSYPVWFFNRERFLDQLSSGYELVREFASEAVWSVNRREYPSTGLLLKRKGHDERPQPDSENASGGAH
ncbi:MAG TPA: methyltransferase, TIGR04325 family [Lacunisphaera sp.]|nr:methyltransferase, TIGR04325 family [Lacunisphaera sp.]